MSNAIRHLTVDAVLAIHEEVLRANGGSDGIRSRELLEAAIAAPPATMMGASIFEDPIEIAAAYFFYLCNNHPFVDGNKKVALASCLVVLQSGGLLPSRQLNVDDWERITLDVASGKLSRGETTERLRELIE